MKHTDKNPTWRDVKNSLRRLDQKALLGVIHDLYAANKDNQAFLIARLSLGSDALEPYKATINRWVIPDVSSDEPVCVAKAQKAISDYKKAVGLAEGLAELTVFYCESSIYSICECGMDDESYSDDLAAMFDQALKAVRKIEPEQRTAFVERLEHIRNQGQDCGWWLGARMDHLMEKHGFISK